MSGQLGYELKDNKKPLTQEDFIKLISEISQVKSMIINNKIPQLNKTNNIFQEITVEKFEGNRNEP